MPQWMPTAIMLMAIVLLTAQSILLFVRKKPISWADPKPQDKKHTSYAAILNLTLGLLALFAFFLFASGALILSPEYGILVAQGMTAWLWTVATILGVSVGMGLVLHAARCRQGRYPSRLLWLVSGGLLVGVITASRMRVLNTEATSDMFRIRCSDMWSYAFLAWIVVILSEWFFTTLGKREHLHRIGGAVFLLTCCGLLVTRYAHLRFIYADHWTLPLWRITALLGLPAVMFLITWICLSRRRLGVVLRGACSALGAIAGFWTATLWTGLALAPQIPKLWKGNLSPAQWAGLVWAAWTVIIVLLTIPRVYRSIRRSIKTKKLDLPDIGNPGRQDDVVALIALAVLIFSILDLCHSTRLDPVWDLTFLILSWVLLTEIISGYPLWKVHCELIEKLRSAEAPIRSLFRTLGKCLSSVLAPVRLLFGAKTVGGVALTVAIVGAILIAISQIPNAGRTIVQPFTSAGLPEQDKNLGQLVSDRAVNTIGLVGEEIRPDLLVASSREGKTNWVPASSDQAADVQAAVASNNVQIPGTSISVPLGFLVSPIQIPMRWLLGVRVIRGSVQKDGDRYVLLANSSTGQTWRVTEPPEDSRLPSEPTPHNAVIEKLADTLAYMIISSDPNLTKLGMTSSWQALPDFRRGLATWKSFRRKQDYDALTSAIKDFRKAIEEDPDFALAHYRLGQALREDGQPRAALDSFRDSLRVNPKFVAGHVALAETLYYFNDYSLPTPAFYSDQQPSSDDVDRAKEDRARRREARLLLLRVVRELKKDASPSDRAAAYVGLCRDALRHTNTPSGQKDEPQLRWQYVAFFYCKRAEYLYSRLPASLREDVRVKDNEVWLLDELGMILSSTNERTPTPGAAGKETVWRCDAEPGYVSDSSGAQFDYYLRSAQKYFQQALDKQPDDPNIRCSLASVSLDLGDKTPMRHLVNDDRVHLALADRLASVAQGEKDPDLYREALDEYRTAIKLSPSNVEALNDYSYLVWEWYLRSVKEGTEQPGNDLLRFAEEYANKATQLTEERGSRANHAMVQSTLGEVELARGEPDAAVKTLKEIIDPQGRGSDAGSHAIFDEVRWDFAEACICASSQGHGSNPELRKRADDLLKEIGIHESHRESRRFPERLETAQMRSLCAQFGSKPVTEMSGAGNPD